MLASRWDAVFGHVGRFGKLLVGLLGWFCRKKRIFNGRRPSINLLKRRIQKQRWQMSFASVNPKRLTKYLLVHIWKPFLSSLSFSLVLWTRRVTADEHIRVIICVPRTLFPPNKLFLVENHPLLKYKAEVMGQTKFPRNCFHMLLERHLIRNWKFSTWWTTSCSWKFLEPMAKAAEQVVFSFYSSWERKLVPMWCRAFPTVRLVCSLLIAHEYEMPWRGTWDCSLNAFIIVQNECLLK